MPNKMTVTDELLLIKEKHKGILYPAHVVEYARNTGCGRRVKLSALSLLSLIVSQRVQQKSLHN